YRIMSRGPAFSSLYFCIQFPLQLYERVGRMGVKINDWVDSWFLSLSENPDKLDKVIRNYEKARMIGMICLVIVLAMNLFTVFMSANPANNGFMFSLVVFMLALTIQTDIFTKVLKLQRQQKNAT
ncbi:MAG: hypothetical protein O7A03_01085, partial [Alphaproteobacteria bacterium]|nr:hypothetical protein [Alphaproteobacteria bacterium]